MPRVRMITRMTIMVTITHMIMITMVMTITMATIIIMATITTITIITTTVTGITPMLMTTNSAGPPPAAAMTEAEAAALYRLLTWLSPAFPVGGFAYSSGIEWAVEAGDITDAASLRDLPSAG